MAFGAPRPIVTVVNLALVGAGMAVLLLVTSWVRWLGLLPLLWGLLAGLIMGSWSQLLPGGRPIGKEEHSDRSEEQKKG